ncbi:Suppressor of Sensor Kinase (SLN1), partial [Tulasnella sp. 403]
MRHDYPECASEKFLQRLDTLTSWFTIITAIRRTIENLKQLTGSDTLDVQPPQTVDGAVDVQAGRRTSAGNGERQSDSSSFVERILKEDGLQRTFERGALIDLHGHVQNARTMYLLYSQELEEMNLPKFTDDLVTIISFPTQLMEQVLRVRLAIAQQVVEPSVLSVDQMLDDFRLAIGLACTLKSDYEELIRPDTEGLWSLPPCIGEEYEDTILAALRFFFKLIHSKLKSAHKGIYFKETELLEAQWYIMEEVTIATKGGGLLVAEHVCSLTHKLILRVILSFQGQIELPVYTMDDSPESRATGLTKFAGREGEGRVSKKQVPEVTAEDTIRWFAKMLYKAFHVYRRSGAYAQEGSEVASENDELGDEEEGQYLLIMTPQDNFVWSGTVLVLTMPTMGLEMQEMRVRLVANSPSRLRVAKHKFATFLIENDDETLSEEDFEPPLQCLAEQQAHLPPVNRELRKINRATQKLAETIVTSVHEIRKILAGADGSQELMENWYMFASEHGQSALRVADPQGQARLSHMLTRLSIAWVAFICDGCDPTDRKTFRWAVNALEFAMVRTRGTNILQLPESDFKTLQQKVASCMTLLVSHFDILGARSSYEEKEKERERWRMEMSRSEESPVNSFVEEGMDELISLEDETAIHCPPDRSMRAFTDRMLRGVANTDARREAVLVEQHIAGRVLLSEGAEDESLSLLASSALKTSIKWQQGRFIAAGAFGSVYLALNIETGGVMAAKEIRFKSSTSLSTLYQQVKDELAVMEVLHHPNIVEYFGLEVHRDKVYIFEEYCAGGTLTGLLESGRIEDETVVKVYTIQMLEGMMYLHSMGV